MYLLLLNSLLILLFSFNESNGRALDSSKLQKRIFNGEDAELFEIPYVLAILFRKEDGWYSFCTGVLVTQNKVLTAAHCVKHYATSDVRVFIGVVHIFGPPSGYEQIISVSNIVVHDGDMGSHPGLPLRDLAVLTLSTPAILNWNVQVVKLSANSASYFNTKCTITGWGITKESTDGTPNTLQKAETTILSRMECETYWPKFKKEFNEGTFVCVFDKYGSPYNRTSMCDGDSGGPLLCGPNRDVLVGIAVSAQRYCQGTLPQIYMDVSVFRDWLADKL